MAVCFERLGAADDGLHVHVSRPPKDGSSGQRLVAALQYAMRTAGSEASVAHKRINLNDDELQWEHERFSLRKMPAVTLSAQRDRMTNRRSILDANVSVPLLTRNTRAIADSLMKVLYGLEDDHGALLEEHWVDEEAVAADLALLTRYPRSQQLMGGAHPVLGSLERVFKRHLQNVRRSKVRADPRDPEFVLYADTEVSITAHRVKPALFDFMVACAIVLYLGVVFVFIEVSEIVLS